MAFSVNVSDHDHMVYLERSANKWPLLPENFSFFSMEEGRPVELPPANSYVRRVQHQIATRYNLDSTSAGKEPQRRVRILPGGGMGFGR